MHALEQYFDESFQALCFDELIRLVEKEAETIEVRRRGDLAWEARLWVEEYTGTTWPLALYVAEGSSAALALLGAWGKMRGSWRDANSSKKSWLNPGGKF